MDFVNFDPSETVMIQTVAQEQYVDDPMSAPFVDENPCLVCGHKAFANFIDLSFGTSCTSQTAIPVKKKLKEILRRVWEPKRDNQILCLACYDLVDRYDVLESQLNNIRENIEDKYQKTGGNKKGTKAKSAQAASKKRGKQGGKGRKCQKKVKAELVNSQEDFDDGDDDGGYVVEALETDNLNDSDYNPGDENIDELKRVDSGHSQQQEQQQYIVIEAQEEPPPNLNVYDEHHQLLQRGEKIRLGKTIKDDNGVDVYACAYCNQVWSDISLLHTHVHAIHQPEVVDVAIPPELGLGNTMNCGVEIQNCREPPENPKPWSCLFCDASFRARTNMSSHFKEKHTPYKPFACVECGDAFRKGIDLNRHKLYFCPHRTVTFAPKRRYKKRDAKERSPQKSRKSDEERCE